LHNADAIGKSWCLMLMEEWGHTYTLDNVKCVGVTPLNGGQQFPEASPRVRFRRDGRRQRLAFDCLG